MNFYTPEEDLKHLLCPLTPKEGYPDVLLIGDSITIGYTRFVRRNLLASCNVHRPNVNCGNTVFGLRNINKWLGSKMWDLIYFNWGLHDLCYRNPDAKTYGNRDKLRGTVSVTPEVYEKNLFQLVDKLMTQSKCLVWANSTYVPEGEVGRFQGDEIHYNEIASKIMLHYNIPIIDLHSATKEFPVTMFTGAGDVHFTEQGYKKIAEVVSQGIKLQLAKNTLAPKPSKTYFKALLSGIRRRIKNTG